MLLEEFLIQERTKLNIRVNLMNVEYLSLVSSLKEFLRDILFIFGQIAQTIVIDIKFIYFGSLYLAMLHE